MKRGKQQQRRREVTWVAGHCPDGCNAQRRPGWCGYVTAGTPCGHPRWREEWERKRKRKCPSCGGGTDGECLFCEWGEQYEGGRS